MGHPTVSAISSLGLLFYGAIKHLEPDGQWLAAVIVNVAIRPSDERDRKCEIKVCFRIIPN
jgi:hypothetical protein